MCAGKIFWGGLVQYMLVMSLVQGTSGQGEMCTERSKVTALSWAPSARSASMPCLSAMNPFVENLSPGHESIPYVR